MDLLFLCQFFLTILAIEIGGILMCLGFIASTRAGRSDIQRFVTKWRLKRQLKNAFRNKDFPRYDVLSPNEFRRMQDYAEADVKMVLALHKHVTKKHATIYDQVVWDHGFDPLNHVDHQVLSGRDENLKGQISEDALSVPAKEVVLDLATKRLLTNNHLTVDETLDGLLTLRRILFATL